MKIEFWKCLKTWAIPIYITWHHEELEISILCFHWYFVRTKNTATKNLVCEYRQANGYIVPKETKDEAMQNL